MVIPVWPWLAVDHLLMISDASFTGGGSVRLRGWRLPLRNSFRADEDGESDKDSNILLLENYTDDYHVAEEDKSVRSYWNVTAWED